MIEGIVLLLLVGVMIGVVVELRRLKLERADDAETIDSVLKDVMQHEERLGSLERSEGREESLNGTMWD